MDIKTKIFGLQAFIPQYPVMQIREISNRTKFGLAIGYDDIKDMTLSVVVSVFNS